MNEQTPAEPSPPVETLQEAVVIPLASKRPRVYSSPQPEDDDPGPRAA